METITRKIHFYKAGAQNSSFQDLANEIIQLPEDDRYLPLSNNEQAFCVLSKNKGGVITGKICTWRNRDYPMKSKAGTLKITPIKLNDSDGLVEITHFVFFPDSNVIGIEYNSTGPRTNILSKYINEKINVVGQRDGKFVHFSPVFNKDTLSQINTLGEVRVLSLMISKNNIEDLKDIDNNIYTSVRAALNFGELEEVELILRPKKNGRKTILKNPADFIKKLKLSNKKRPLDETFDKLSMRAIGYGESKLQDFDLLRDRVVSEIQAIKLNDGKGVDSKDMYSKITESYKTKQKELLEITKHL